MIRRPPRSTPLYSSAASDVYKRQVRMPSVIWCSPRPSLFRKNCWTRKSCQSSLPRCRGPCTAWKGLEMALRELEYQGRVLTRLDEYLTELSLQKKKADKIAATNVG